MLYTAYFLLCSVVKWMEKPTISLQNGKMFKVYSSSNISMCPAVCKSMLLDHKSGSCCPVGFWYCRFPSPLSSFMTLKTLWRQSSDSIVSLLPRSAATSPHWFLYYCSSPDDISHFVSSAFFPPLDFSCWLFHNNWLWSNKRVHKVIASLIHTYCSLITPSQPSSGSGGTHSSK